jgi:hypothetical protein
MFNIAVHIVTTELWMVKQGKEYDTYAGERLPELRTNKSEALLLFLLPIGL